VAGEGQSIIEIIAIVLALVGAGEILASQFVSSRLGPQTKLIATVLFWEGIAMLACAGVLYVRQDLSMTTIVSIVALWLAGGAIGLLRGGVFDAPKE
jgi:hypothetical protein